MSRSCSRPGRSRSGCASHGCSRPGTRGPPLVGGSRPSLPARPAREPLTRESDTPGGVPSRVDESEEDAVKGDRVEVVVDAGGSSRTYEIEASRAGRRGETTPARGVVEVTEVTRGGTPVRTARFMAGRVLALVEHPAARRVEDDEQVPAPVRRVRAA